MKADAEERGALLQAIGSCSLEIVSDGNLGLGFLRPGDLRFSELAFGDTLGGELSQDHDFSFVDVMVQNLEGPLGVENVVQPLNHSGALNVIEHIAVEALPLLDLVGRKRLFQ